MDHSTLEFELKLRQLASEYLSDEDGVHSRINYMFLASFECSKFPIYASRIVDRLSSLHKGLTPNLFSGQF